MEIPDNNGASIFSIAWNAIRNDIIYISVSTWYKYVHLLGLVHSLPSNRRKNHKTGIRALIPKEIIHADLTIYRPLDNIKVYISIIMDNFSRFILGWKASLKPTAKLCLDNLKQVYDNYLNPIHPNNSVELIVDGGSENNNESVNTFISDIDGLQKLIAQKDIIFSNSMVEAVNKTLKYRYLFQKELPDYKSTIKYLKNHAINDYNHRPHSALNGQTPYEIFHGIKLDRNKIKQQFEQARINRIQENRKQRCQNCDD